MNNWNEIEKKFLMLRKRRRLFRQKVFEFLVSKDWKSKDIFNFMKIECKLLIIWGRRKLLKRKIYKFIENSYLIDYSIEELFQIVDEIISRKRGKK